MVDTLVEAEDYRNLITRLKRAYVDKKRRKVPNYRLSARFNAPNIWIAVAKKVEEVGAHPDDWIEAAFTYSSFNNGPYPNALAGKAAERWYSQYRRKEENGTEVTLLWARVKQDFAYLLDVLVQNKKNGIVETLEETLLDEFNRIAPYVRVVVGGKDYPSVKERWGEEARKLLDNYTEVASAVKDMGYSTDIIYE